MYYYIFEPTDDKKTETLYEEIKQRLNEAGIGGEFVTLSHAEEPADLAKVALRKDFSTVIAIGSDSMINQVASGIIDTSCVLGVIPINPSSIFFPLINAENYLEALEALPGRKIEPVDTVVINNEYSLLTSAKITPTKKSASAKSLIIASFDNDFVVEASSREITVSNIGIVLTKKSIANAVTDGLIDVFIPMAEKDKKSIFLSLFRRRENKKEDTKEGSYLHPAKAIFESRHGLIAKIDGEEITRGKIQVRVAEDTLRIIKRRERPVHQREELIKTEVDN